MSGLLAAPVLAASLLTACSGGGDEQVVRVYSGRHYDLEQAFVEFADETGVSVEFLTGSDAELRERIQAEGSDTQADVYLTVDAGNLAVAAADDLFQPLDSTILDNAIPANLRDPENRWFGLSVRARTIVYNSDVLGADEVPDSYEALADPEWADRLCLRDSSNVYTQSLVASLIIHDGEARALEVVRGWADNAEILNNDVLIVEEIAAGGCDLGVVNHYYLARILDEKPDTPVALVWVDQPGGSGPGRGVHVNISGGGVTRYADNPDLAQQLLEWLATDGQSVFVDGNHEYPANPAVEPDSFIAEHFGPSFTADPLDASAFGDLNAEAVRLMDEAGYR